MSLRKYIEYKEELSRVAREVPDDPALRGNYARTLANAKKQLGNIQGLALPQLGINARGILVKKGKQYKVCFNPVIVKLGRKELPSREVCLSSAGEWEVKRHNSVCISYTNVDGKRRKLRLRWPKCRVLEHEIDHLNGRCLEQYGVKVRDLDEE